jgi:hypothetical protein
MYFYFTRFFQHDYEDDNGCQQVGNGLDINKPLDSEGPVGNVVKH